MSAFSVGNSLVDSFYQQIDIDARLIETATKAARRELWFQPENRDTSNIETEKKVGDIKARYAKARTMKEREDIEDELVAIYKGDTTFQEKYKHLFDSGNERVITLEAQRLAAEEIEMYFEFPLLREVGKNEALETIASRTKAVYQSKRGYVPTHEEKQKALAELRDKVYLQDEIFVQTAIAKEMQRIGNEYYIARKQVPKKEIDLETGKLQSIVDESGKPVLEDIVVLEQKHIINRIFHWFSTFFYPDSPRYHSEKTMKDIAACIVEKGKDRTLKDREKKGLERLRIVELALANTLGIQGIEDIFKTVSKTK